MKLVKNIVVVVALMMFLSSCFNLKSVLNKDKSESETSTDKVEESTSNLEESTSETTTTEKSETTTTKAQTTTTKVEKKEIVEDFKIPVAAFKDDIRLPLINEKVLDFEDAKNFNRQVDEISATLCKSKAKVEGVKSDYEYIDSADYLSIKISGQMLASVDDGTTKYFAKTVMLDKKNKKALKDVEILDLYKINKEELISQYVAFLKGLTYRDEKVEDKKVALEEIAAKGAQYVALYLTDELKDIPMYYDGKELIVTLPKINTTTEKFGNVDLVFGKDYLDFAHKNKLGGFSRVKFDEKIDINKAVEINLAVTKNTKKFLIKAYKDGELQIQRVKEDFENSELLVRNIEHTQNVKKGDLFIVTLDNEKRLANDNNAAFYRVVLKGAEDKYYIMDVDLSNPLYENVPLEYVLNTTKDYRNKLEASNNILKNGVNLLGIPLERINQLYGYEYKLNPTDEEEYVMVYENEKYPVLTFDGKEKNSTVQKVFSNFTGYNMINDINVGMTALQVEEKLGGYDEKVIGGNELYNSYTLFSVDEYDVYVYGKDTDLVSFGMEIRHKGKSSKRGSKGISKKSIEKSIKNKKVIENKKDTKKPKTTENKQSTEKPKATENNKITEKPKTTENKQSTEKPKATENKQSTEKKK